MTPSARMEPAGVQAQASACLVFSISVAQSVWSSAMLGTGEQGQSTGMCPKLSSTVYTFKLWLESVSG